MKVERKDKINVPNLRFPGFEEEWKVGNLGDIMDFKVTNSFSRDNLNYEKGKVKNIHYGDIHKEFQTLFDISKENVPYINEDISIDRISKDYYCEEGDMVFADASEDLNDVGKSIEIINLDNVKLLAGLHTILARPKASYFYTGFTGYLFKSNNIKLQIQKESQGTKVLSISSKRISKVKLLYPSLNEQKKISNFFQLLDNRIQTSIEIIDNLEYLKSGFYQSIFSHKLNFMDDNKNEFPKWDTKYLGEISSIKTGKLDANAMVDNGEYRFYTCAKDFYLINNYAFDTNALLISGNGANVGYIHHYNGKFNAYQRTYVLDDFKENIIYIKYYLHKFLSVRIEREKKDGNTPYIVLSTLKDMLIKIPCQSEQTKIATFLNSISEKLETEKKLLEQFQNQKKYFLQNLFI